MESCLGELHLTWCIIYLDDIIVFSQTPEEHLLRLSAVFDKPYFKIWKLPPVKRKKIQVHQGLQQQEAFETLQKLCTELPKFQTLQKLCTEALFWPTQILKPLLFSTQMPVGRSSVLFYIRTRKERKGLLQLPLGA